MLDSVSSNESATETETSCVCNERCNVKIVIQFTYFYSVQQIAIRVVNHFPMQASSQEECKIKD